MNAYIFDVDGVLTDPLKKRTTPELLQKLGHILENGDTLAFNTGRSLPWFRERILDPLMSHIANSELFSRLFVTCEMGNITLAYRNSALQEAVDPNARIPETLISEIKNLVAEKYAESMFFDPKVTMISVEMKDGFDHTRFQEQENKLFQEIFQIINKQEYQKLQLKTNKDVIAINIQFQNAGKRLGAQKIEEWMREKGFTPEKVYMFGDSESDIEMAEELKHMYPVTFIFVNEPEALKLGDKKTDFEIIYTTEQFDRGTLEFLNTLVKPS